MAAGGGSAAGKSPDFFMKRGDTVATLVWSPQMVPSLPFTFLQFSNRAAAVVGQLTTTLAGTAVFFLSTRSRSAHIASHAFCVSFAEAPVNFVPHDRVHPPIQSSRGLPQLYSSIFTSNLCRNFVHPSRLFSILPEVVSSYVPRVLSSSSQSSSEDSHSRNSGTLHSSGGARVASPLLPVPLEARLVPRTLAPINSSSNNVLVSAIIFL